MPRKAVVFTHMDPRGLSLEKADWIRTYAINLQKRFEAFLRCRNVGLLIVYVSKGLENALEHRFEPGAGGSFWVNGAALDLEARVINIQRMAWDMAVRSCRSSDPNFSLKKAPRATWVGLRELAHLLNTLLKIEPSLVNNLAGKGDQRFTYDSPKFVEAVVRLVRGTNLHLGEPVLRIDSDVWNNEAAVDDLLKQAEEREHMSGAWPFYFFSGRYIGPVDPECPANAYAVRQHWLVDPATWNARGGFRLLPGAEHFMRDLGEVGATQVVEKQDAPGLSHAGHNLVLKRKGRSLNRNSRQVISGACLVMSTQAIKKLPPFMNATEMIVWVDDHLKRQLHEALGHLSPDSTESVETARLVQDRYDAITEDSVRFAEKEYFRRLLLGCLMNALIKDAAGQPGPLTKCIQDILELNLKSLPDDTRQKLKSELYQAARERFDEVITLWRDADYGNSVLRDWAVKNAGEADPLCDAAARNGVCYAELVLVWQQQYVFAISQLMPWDAYWAFMPVQ